MPEQAPVEAFLDHVTAFDYVPAVNLAMDWADAHGAEAAIDQLLAPAQHEVGRRWEFGEWTVAQEHAATAIVDDVIGGIHVDLDVDVRMGAPHVALVCAEDEWHVTPLRMAAVRFLARQWQVTLLGASTPADHLRTTLEALRPDAVGVSAMLAVTLDGARRTVQAAHDVGIPVVAAGAGLGTDGHRAEAIGAEVGGLDVDTADPVMRGWLDRAVELRSPVRAHPEEVERLRATRRVVARGSLARMQGSRPVMCDYDARRAHGGGPGLDPPPCRGGPGRRGPAGVHRLPGVVGGPAGRPGRAAPAAHGRDQCPRRAAGRGPRRRPQHARGRRHLRGDGGPLDGCRWHSVTEW